MEQRVARLESAVFDDRGNKGLATKAHEIWEAFWRWHDQTWIEWVSKRREESCFYLREKEKMRESKKFSMAKFAFIAKEIVMICAVLTLLLKVFKVI